MKFAGKINSIGAEEISLALIDKHEKKKIFEDTGLTAKGGMITYILGPSGSGKSLMLKALAGLLDQEIDCEIEFAGRILWGDKDISDLSERNKREWRARSFGIIFQDLRLIEYLTGKENIEFPLYILKKDIKGAMKTNTEYHEALGLKEFWDQKVCEMSGGEKQRIAIARALITSPQVILADEPTTGLDEKLREVVEDILAQEAEKGKVVMVITHDDRRASIAEDNRISYRLRPDKHEFFVAGQASLQVRRLDEKLAQGCPYCGNSAETWQMRRVKNTNIVIDVCTECGGVWLDAGEWEQIISYPMSIMEELEKVIDEIKTAKIPLQERE